MTQLRLLPLLFVSLSLAAQTPYLVRDINTTYNSATVASSPAEFATFGNRIAFTASPDRTNRELWITDGSGSGTTKLLTVAATTTYFAAPIAVRNTLLFSARDVNHGSELWGSDGTVAGTHMLLDLNPGPSSADPGDHIVYKNLLFFSADDGTHGRELWTSDGTAGGTRLFKDIVPGTPSSFVGTFIPFQGDLYLYAAAVAGAGFSEAQTTLTNLPPSPTITLNYAPSDTLYSSATQQLRVTEARRRVATH